MRRLGIRVGVFSLSSSERSVAASVHNAYRQQLANGLARNKGGQSMPKGKNIYKLKYDTGLENRAQRWANNCEFKHSSGGAGENLFMSSAKMSATDAIKQAAYLWWAELQQYGMNSRDTTLTSSEFNKGIGHWTQMAWGAATKVGCGVAHCRGNVGTLVVCNYDKGNLLNAKVYEMGQPCRKNTDFAVVAKKRRASSPGYSDSPVKRADLDVVAAKPNALALTALLEEVSSYMNGALYRIMNLQGQDAAERSGIVAEMSHMQAKVNLQLGIVKKNIREVLGSDALLDVFAFLSRSELDTLQLVNASFDVIIEGKMQLICVRRVARAAMHCRTPGRVFVLTITLEGARKEIRFSTGVIDECAAFVQLLSACRSSRVELLEMYGDTPLTEAHVDAVFRHAPYILMGNFRLGARALPESVSNDSFLQILDSFAEMRKVDIAPDFYTAEMQRFLVRRGFMFQVGFCAKFRGSYDILRWEPKCSVDDETLLHFSFAECDGRWATRWRRLSLSSSDLTPDFLQRWIKKIIMLYKIDNTCFPARHRFGIRRKQKKPSCLHQLFLYMGRVIAQNLHGLDVYRSDDGNDRRRKVYHSKTGRPWTVIYYYDDLKFTIR
ncbi:VAP1 protein [Aphelenchoides avenae]|nr:VAP1 protein [Aphelenchus avenae]